MNKFEDVVYEKLDNRHLLLWMLNANEKYAILAMIHHKSFEF